MKVFTMHSVQIPTGQVVASHATPFDLTSQIQAVLPGYMQLPADTIRDDVFLLPEKLPLTPTRRLVVLVPPGEIAENALARRVWQLANSASLEILYLELSREDDYSSYYTCRLTNLIMMTSYGDIRVHSSISTAKSWIEAVKQILQLGDVLVCLVNHQIYEHFVWRRRLGEQLEQATGAPVYMLSGFEIGPSLQWQHIVKSIWAWTASLALLIGFFGIQIGIQHSTTKSLSLILICMSVVFELYLILKVNEWIG